MQPTEDPNIDWTGVQPDRSRIAPLDGNSFIARLRLLSERANSLTILRNAFNQEQSDGKQLPRYSEPAPRQ